MWLHLQFIVVLAVDEELEPEKGTCLLQSFKDRSTVTDVVEDQGLQDLAHARRGHVDEDDMAALLSALRKRQQQGASSRSTQDKVMERSLWSKVRHLFGFGHDKMQTTTLAPSMNEDGWPIRPGVTNEAAVAPRSQARTLEKVDEEQADHDELQRQLEEARLENMKLQDRLAATFKDKLDVETGTTNESVTPPPSEEEK